MGFDVTRFSQAGLNALAELTASKTLKITQIITSVNTHSDADLDQSVAYWRSENTPDVESKITSVGAADGEARVVVSLNLAPSVLVTTNIKALVIIACTTQGGIDSDEIVLCGILDPNGIDVIYNNSGINVSAKIALYFRFNNTSSITVQNAISPDYVLQSDLDRFVSCHTATDNVSGDDQIIYGIKRFKNFVHVGDNITDPYGHVDLAIGTNDSNKTSFIRSGTQLDGSTDPKYQTLTFNAEESLLGSCITTNVSFLPDRLATSDVTLGQPAYRFNMTYFDDCDCNEYYINGGSLWIRDQRDTNASPIGNLNANEVYHAITLRSNPSYDVRIVGGNNVVLNSVDGDISISSNNDIVLQAGGSITFNGTVAFSNINLTNAVVSENTTTHKLYTTELYFNEPFLPQHCDLIPKTASLKPGAIFLAVLMANEWQPACSAGLLIPGSVKVYAAKSTIMTQDAAQDPSGTNTHTPHFTYGTQYANNGLAFTLMHETNQFGPGRFVLALVMCINETSIVPAAPANPAS